jgi:hypothetical protein
MDNFAVCVWMCIINLCLYNAGKSVELINNYVDNIC